MGYNVHEHMAEHLARTRKWDRLWAFLVGVVIGYAAVHTFGIDCRERALFLRLCTDGEWVPWRVAVALLVGFPLGSLLSFRALRRWRSSKAWSG